MTRIYQRTKPKLSIRLRDYDVTTRYDRVCIHLRKGDFEVLRAAHPEGVSAWIREFVAERCDELRAEQKARAKAANQRLLAIVSDPDL